METVANNLANANTPGFKREEVNFKEVMEKAKTSQVALAGSHLIFEQGSLVPTGNDLDLGLRGKGFFEIETKNGIRYRRNGSFNITPQGFLVTSGGDFLLSSSSGENDRRIKVIPGSSNIEVDQQGAIKQQENIISKISVVEFLDVNKLKKEGGSLYLNEDPQNKRPEPSQTTVHQGLIEQSNVNVVKEMNQLIQANRQFETLQRVIKTYDSLEAKAVNEISNF